MSTVKVKEYIESGILENYILGVVTDSERQEVESMAVKHPEVRAELTAIENALATYAQNNAVSMPEGLSGNILKNIDRLEKLESKAEGFSKATSLTARLWPVLAIAASILLLVTIYFMGQNNELKNQIAESQIILDSLQTNCAETQNKLAKLENYISITRDRNYESVIMKGESLNKAPLAIAAVFYNTTDEKAYLEVENLPQPPSDKQYQLWAITDEGPQSMDVFDVKIGPEGLIEVPFFANAQAFAVTLEPKGGSVGPTMEEMYVIGTAG